MDEMTITTLLVIIRRLFINPPESAWFCSRPPNESFRLIIKLNQQICF